MRHKLTLVRKSNDDANFKIAATAKGKVELTKVAWVMPRAHPNDVKSLVCTKSLNRRFSWTPHFECASVVLSRYPLKHEPLTGGWALAPHRKSQDMF